MKYCNIAESRKSKKLRKIGSNSHNHNIKFDK